MKTEIGGSQHEGTTSPETLRRARRGGRGVGRAGRPAHEPHQTPTVPEPAKGNGPAEVEAPAGLPGRTSTQGQALAPMASEEWQRIDQAYREIQRRDGSAEQRAWRWERFALVLVGLVILLLGVVVWQLLDARKVQAVVQVVQLDEQGHLVQVGLPTDLLTYTPPEGLWMDMLGAWVRRLRWRGLDTVLARVEWAWLYRHTCGQARRLLQTLEERDKPFEVKKKLVSVELKSVTKTPAPESYQVLWTETSTEQAQPTVKTAQWTGTFTVGRYRPPTLADTLDNRLGLCVTAFDLSPQP